MPKVTIVNEKKEIEVPAGSNLRQELRKAEVQIYRGIDKYLNCRGLGACGTCKVYVKSGMENLSPKGLIEKMNLNFHPMTAFASIGHENEIRLSCQTTVNGDCSIEVRPEFNMSGENFWQKPYPNK
jgi:ferredoxin